MVTLLLAGLCLIAVVMLLRFLWQRPRFQALRQLRRSSKQSSDPRRQLFYIKQVLQQGLQVNQLQRMTFSTSQQETWQRFCAELRQACYQPTAPSRHDVKRLTTQARCWIKRA